MSIRSDPPSIGIQFGEGTKNLLTFNYDKIKFLKLI